MLFDLHKCSVYVPVRQNLEDARMGIGSRLNGTLTAFIKRQPLFFVATADQTGRVNLSPKGMDTLGILDDTRIIWLNLSGSGNETAAHVRASGRMTLMFCAFEGDALIVRVYGQAKVYHPRNPEWRELIMAFPEIAGSRQIFDLTIDLVQTSCGTGVPIMEFRRSRAEHELVPFYEDMGVAGVQDYWRRKNSASIDGKPTGVFEDI
jgi:Pyridoxamine 5'-phosphate oxidase